ncbi:hypothetical protein [Siphonobacter aquaeclarae]|uniref:FecR family protein n=1 Tax=Siphonobacter aquaeclarae TaxID=563176 RepID=A0A1G9HUE2_9BACT|nr:hypothetical protein [Siphonobacter aquaeclarae]SDL16445.1 hypothetical protein SAMN04488090_0206 [Siphonobacter aquaeclarae]
MPIPITPALLTRYHEGRCTPEEQAAVADWLSDPTTDDTLPLPELSEVHGARIWKGVARGMRPRRYLRGLAAVAVLAVVGCFFVFRPAPPDVWTARNDATGTSAADLGGLGIALSPQSTVQVRETDGIRQVDFSGAVEVTNRTGRDICLVFGSGNRARQTIRLAAGRSCVAVQYHFRSDEIVVVKRLLDLPPVLLTRIRNDFRAI